MRRRRRRRKRRPRTPSSEEKEEIDYEIELMSADTFEAEIQKETARMLPQIRTKLAAAIARERATARAVTEMRSGGEPEGGLFE